MTCPSLPSASHSCAYVALHLFGLQREQTAPDSRRLFSRDTAALAGPGLGPCSSAGLLASSRWDQEARAPAGVSGPKLKMPSAVPPGMKHVRCNLQPENLSAIPKPGQTSGSAHSAARARSLVLAQVHDGSSAAGDGPGLWGEGHAPGRCPCRKPAAARTLRGHAVGQWDEHETPS